MATLASLASMPSSEVATVSESEEPSYLFVCCHRCLTTIMIKSLIMPDPEEAGAHFVFTTCRTCLATLTRASLYVEDIQPLITKQRDGFRALHFSKGLVKSSKPYQIACNIADCEVDVKMNEDDRGMDYGVLYISILEIVVRTGTSYFALGVNMEADVDGEDTLLPYLPMGFL